MPRRVPGGRLRKRWALAGLLLLAAAFLAWPRPIPARVDPVRPRVDADPTSSDPVVRGGYLAILGGCLGCHTAPDGAALAGGYPVATPFGRVYGTNLTGLSWSEADFGRALREGRGPDGTRYYPVFPYASFAVLTDADVADLWAWLRAQPASDRPNTRHDLRFPANIRATLAIWQAIEVRPATPTKSRGEYLVRGVLHCGECHTPRDLLGGMKPDAFLAGTDDEPEPGPDIRPDALVDWSAYDLETLFADGTLPDGDQAAKGMKHVVRDRTSKLTAGDRDAVIAYLKGG